MPAMKVPQIPRMWTCTGLQAATGKSARNTVMESQ